MGIFRLCKTSNPRWRYTRSFFHWWGGDLIVQHSLLRKCLKYGVFSVIPCWSPNDHPGRDRTGPVPVRGSGPFPCRPGELSMSSNGVLCSWTWLCQAMQFLCLCLMWLSCSDCRATPPTLVGKKVVLPPLGRCEEVSTRFLRGWEVRKILSHDTSLESERSSGSSSYLVGVRAIIRVELIPR